MKHFFELRLATRLTLSFAAVLLLTMALGIFSIVQLARVNVNTTDVATHWMPASVAALEMKSSMARYRLQLLHHILSTKDVELAKYEKGMADALARFEKNRQTYVKLIESPEQQAAYDTFMALWGTYLKENSEIIALSRQMKSDEARDLLQGKSAQLNSAVSERIIQLGQVNVDGGILAAKASEIIYVESRRLIIGLLAGSVLIGSLAAVLMIRWLTRQLGGEPGYAGAVAGRIAAGDLAVEVAVKAGDRSSLLFAMKSMRDNLTGIVSEVRIGAESIASASQQIATGNLDLSARTEQQAGSLEETASSMEELTSTVSQNAENARRASMLATTASEVADKGGEVVAQVVGTMSSINDASKKIVDIIGVIDSIAFQTNILALNAAVEAARAGGQGRGFAVVAAEVRNLAQRSAAAAKEIKALIGDSVEKVDVGARLVDRAGTTMAEIVDSVRRVNDIMSEISTATQEQTVGIEQINQAIAQMDEVTQQNAALVEQAAAASQSMQHQAAGLARTVSLFKLDATQATAKAAAVPSAGTR